MNRFAFKGFLDVKFFKPALQRAQLQKRKLANSHSLRAVHFSLFISL